MLIDSRVSLAMAVQARRGVYALLLGSGISRPAQIPTGYELMCDLIRQVARLSGADDPPDPEAWFREKYGVDATYSRVLEGAAHSRADRSNLLRPYFVPTEEEMAEGKKVPTKAHRAIARMARSGYFKVAVTTNFDPLLEQALSEAGVARQVVATPEAAGGMTPLAHADFTVVKVHGDYLDLATSNTVAELSSYDPEIDAVLDEVLTNYGLLACGWSGEWDEALRKAIVRNTNHRFGTYWMTVRDLAARGQELVAMRAADVVRIESADEAFEDLEQKLLAIEEGRRTHPLSAEIARETAKRYLADPVHRIRLDDLVRRETRALTSVLGTDFRVDGPVPDEHAIRHRIERGEAAGACLAAIFAAGGRWGSSEHHRMWVESLSTLVHYRSERSSYNVWRDLWYYPACLTLYAGGIAALTSGNYATLRVLLEDCRAESDGKNRAIGQVAAAASVLDPKLANAALEHVEPKRTPMSDRVFKVLRPLLGDLAGTDARYEEMFDTFEFLLGMTTADFHRAEEATGPWGPWTPVGRFVWHCHHAVPGIPAKSDAITNEWPPLASGMFGGDLDRAKRAHDAVRRAWGEAW